jgi:hypothetical protein
MELEGPMPADSPRFPKGPLITPTLLKAYPNAEAGTPWRSMCQALVGGGRREGRYARVAAFLGGAAADVSGLASHWLTAREQEVAETGRRGAQPGALTELTLENTEALLLRIHECAKTLVGEERDPDKRRLAESPLQGAVSTLLSMTTARLDPGPPGLRQTPEWVANLVCDCGMAIFLSMRLLSALRGICEGTLIRCIDCGKIEKPVRRPQKRCRVCAHQPGVRQRAARKQKPRSEA